jgi:CHAT domain-containing protein
MTEVSKSDFIHRFLALFVVLIFTPYSAAQSKSISVDGTPSNNEQGLYAKIIDEPILLFEDGESCDDFSDQQLKRKVGAYLVRVSLLASEGKISEKAVENSFRGSIAQTSGRNREICDAVRISLFVPFGAMYPEKIDITDLIELESKIESFAISDTEKNRLNYLLIELKVLFYKRVLNWNQRVAHFYLNGFLRKVRRNSEGQINYNENKIKENNHASQKLIHALKYRENIIISLYSKRSKEYTNARRDLAQFREFYGEIKKGEIIRRDAIKYERETANLPLNHISDSLKELGVNLAVQGRCNEAIPIFDQAIRLRQAAQNIKLRLDHSLVESAVLCRQSIGLLTEAALNFYLTVLNDASSEPVSQASKGKIDIDIRPAVRRLNQLFGNDTVSASAFPPEMYMSSAGALLAHGSGEEAFALFHAGFRDYVYRTIDSLLAPNKNNNDLIFPREAFGNYLKASSFYINQRLSPAQQSELLGDLFKSFQLSHVTSTERALARLAARFASNSNNLAKLIQRIGNIKEQILKLEKELISQIGLSEQGSNSSKITYISKEIWKLEKSKKVLTEEVINEFPEYRTVSAGLPLELETTKALLKENEALIGYFFVEREGYAWVVTSKNVNIVHLSFGAKDIAKIVDFLRLSLSSSGVERIEDLMPFDMSQAHILYKKVFLPIEPFLENIDHIFVLGDGALNHLPLGVLVSQRPMEGRRDFSAYRNASWLARKYAISLIPSIGTLGTLRLYPKPTSSATEFVGFGDPNLHEQSQAHAFSSAEAKDNKHLVRKSAISTLGALPDTRDELRAIELIVGPSNAKIFLGDMATEKRVKRSDLSSANVISFATHALVAGELEGIDEPGLVLTPPLEPNDEDDGFLGASEVAQLKLNADWVILSACNTAAPDGTPGAASLSGLAKAFFYAGTRAIVVSHWPVISSAANRLVVALFAAIENRGHSKADALRHSMLQLIENEDQPYMAHPIFWAPFSIVGEGG